MTEKKSDMKKKKEIKASPLTNKTFLVMGGCIAIIFIAIIFVMNSGEAAEGEAKKIIQSEARIVSDKVSECLDTGYLPDENDIEAPTIRREGSRVYVKNQMIAHCALQGVDSSISIEENKVIISEIFNVYATLCTCLYDYELVLENIPEGYSFEIKKSENILDEFTQDGETEEPEIAEEPVVEGIDIDFEYLQTKDGHEDFDIKYEEDAIVIRSIPKSRGKWALKFTIEENIDTFGFSYMENSTIQIYDPQISMKFYSDDIEFSENIIKAPPAYDYFYLAEARVDVTASYFVGQREMWGTPDCWIDMEYCDSLRNNVKGWDILTTKYLNELAKEFKTKEITPNLEGPVTVLIIGDNLIETSDHFWKLKDFTVNGEAVNINKIISYNTKRAIYSAD